MGEMIREKHHRLMDDLYRGTQVVSFTACVKNRVPFFTTQDRFTVFEEMLHDELKRFECGCEVYLFMPDHAHLLLRGESEKADVLRAMRSFKTENWCSGPHAIMPRCIGRRISMTIFSARMKQSGGTSCIS